MTVGRFNIGESLPLPLFYIYGAPSNEETRRYSPAICIGCEMKTVSGDPDPKHVSTSYVERHNLSMRMGMRRFTRLTNAFSKKIQNHAAMVAIYAVHYNFARIHKTLRISPAMACGLAITFGHWKKSLRWSIPTCQRLSRVALTERGAPLNGTDLKSRR